MQKKGREDHFTSRLGRFLTHNKSRYKCKVGSWQRALQHGVLSPFSDSHAPPGRTATTPVPVVPNILATPTSDPIVHKSVKNQNVDPKIAKLMEG